MPPATPNPEPKLSSGYSLVIVGAALFAFIHAFSLLAPILLSFLLIVIISFAVNPLVSRIRSLTGGRKVSTAVVAGALVLVIVLAGWAFCSPLKASVGKLSERLPEYWERLQKPLIKLEKKALLSEEKLQAEVSREIAQAPPTGGKPEATQRTNEPAPPTAAKEPSLAARKPPATAKEPDSLRSNLSQMIQAVAGSFTAVAFNAAQIVVVLVTVFFGVTFTLMTPRPLLAAFFSLVPGHQHERALGVLQQIGKFMPNWALGTLLSMATIGMLVFLLMWPLFGFMDALVLGLIAGIFESVPYVGPILSVVPALLFAMGEGGSTPLWVLLAYGAIQALENNVISPLIMAQSMKLHPVAVIFSMLICVVAFGVLGAVIAPPMVVIVSILHAEFYRKRFLPMVTDADLERLAQKALHERVAEDK